MCCVQSDSSHQMKANVNDVQSSRSRHIQEHVSVICVGLDQKSTRNNPDVDCVNQAPIPQMMVHVTNVL